ncbi:MAG: ABC transporter substrate-binding protein [Deltaproteobacteria bacterium]|nr:ABC transporter substrate-binding protein [Deltaproteobacteria bacterium]
MNLRQIHFKLPPCSAKWAEAPTGPLAGLAVRLAMLRLAMLMGLATAVVLPANAQAQQKIIIGALYPLSGPVAHVGAEAKLAINTALDIINNEHDLGQLPLAARKGLKGLNGAQVEVLIADHMGRPEIAQREAARLVTERGAHALFGAYLSSATLAAARAAERMGVPLLNADSGSPSLTGQGLRWLFRTGPHDGEYSELMFSFLEALREEKGFAVRSLAIVHENSTWGSGSAQEQLLLSRRFGFPEPQIFEHPPRAESFTVILNSLMKSRPDVILPSAFTFDAIGFVRQARQAGYALPLVIAQDAGYSSPAFIQTLGADAEGVITRAAFHQDLARRQPLLAAVDKLYRSHSKGQPLEDTGARIITGLLVLADAINRAESGDPEEIREALRDTDWEEEQLIMPWRGVRFGDDGQNRQTRGILLQVQNGQYCSVYPFALGACPLRLPGAR